MQAISTQALSTRPSTAALSSRAKRNAKQPSRPVIAAAAKGHGEERTEQQGPNKIVMSAVGAIAAVQLALGGPAFAQDPLPSSAESQSARDEVNKETSDAPGLGSIAKNLTGNLFGGSSDAPSVGQAKDAADQAANKAKNAAPDLSQDPLPASAESQGARDEVNRETSQAPGLGSIAKSLQGQFGGSGADDAKQAAGQAADQAANKAKNAAPDLSGIFDRAQSSVDKITKEAGSAPSQFPDALTKLGNTADFKASQAKNKASDTASAAGSKASQAKGEASKAAGKAKNAAPDLSGLLDDIQSKVSGDVDTTSNKVKGDIDTTQNKVQGDIDTTKNKVKGDVATTQGKVESDINTARNAAPDLSDASLPQPGDLLSRLQGNSSFDALKRQADKAGSKAQNFGADVGNKGSQAASKAKGGAKDAGRKAKNAAPDLSFGSVEEAKNEADNAAKKVQNFGSDIGSKGSQAGDKAQGAAQDASRQAKNAAPDLSFGSVEEAKKEADKAGQKVQNFGSDVGNKGSQAGDKAQNAAKDAGRQAKNAAPDLSLDPLGFFKQQQEETKDAAAQLQGTGGQDFNAKGGPSPSTPDSKELAKGLKQGSDSLPVPDVGGDVDTGGFDKLNQKPTEGTLSK